MTPKAAIFDVFGTVVDWRRGVAEAVAPVLAEKRIAVAPEDFADAWRGEYDPAMARVREGARGYVPLDDLHLENLARVLARFAIAERFSEAERREMNHAWEKLPPWADSVAGLAAIRARRLVAPCSNGSVALMARLARFAGLEWDCILGADTARNYKPDPAVYLDSAAALRLATVEVVMVAAHNGDLHAARAAGLKTAFVPRPGEHGPGQTTDLAPEGDWDYVAADFPALARQLSG